jgi:CRISPR-associated exonuclease Cas4
MIESSFSPLFVGIALAFCALFVWIWARAKRNAAGLPQGEVIYSDSGTWYRQYEALYSPDLELVGRPDYLVEDHNGEIVPVEIKSTLAPSEPHEGHVLQLAAYCLLVANEFGSRPTHGILQYRDKAFGVDYTVELEEDLLDLLAEMREDIFEDELDRDHDEWRRCAHCGMREFCSQRLV